MAVRQSEIKKHIQIHPLAGALGAEVAGVDLSQPLDDEPFEEIHPDVAMGEVETDDRWEALKSIKKK